MLLFPTDIFHKDINWHKTFVHNQFRKVKSKFLVLASKYYWGAQRPRHKYNLCYSLPENILSLTPTSNLLTQKYIHFTQSTFTRVDTQPFATKGIPQRQQTTINTILLYVRDSGVTELLGALRRFSFVVTRHPLQYGHISRL